MIRIWLPLAIAVAAIGYAAVEFVDRYPDLPNRVATHFNASGQPDGWMSKRQFAISSVSMVAIPGFMLGMASLVAWIVPAQCLNLPRKEYWLAPEREAETRRMIVARMVWLIAGVMLLMAYISHAVLEFNIHRNGQLAVWGPLAGFMTFVVAWCVELIWTFSHVPRSDA